MSFLSAFLLKTNDLAAIAEYGNGSNVVVGLCSDKPDVASSTSRAASKR